MWREWYATYRSPLIGKTKGLYGDCSTRRGLGRSWGDAATRCRQHTEPSRRNDQLWRWNRNRRRSADLTTGARDDGAESGLPLAARARIARNVCRVHRSHDDRRKCDPQHSRHEGERRHDAGGQGDHGAILRGRFGTVSASQGNAPEHSRYRRDTAAWDWRGAHLSTLDLVVARRRRALHFKRLPATPL